MNFSKKLILAGLVLVLVPALSCNREQRQREEHEKRPLGFRQPGSGPGPGNHYGRKKDRAFSIYIYTDDSGNCYVDTPGVVLWKSANQTAQWISDDDSKEYLVDFTRGQAKHSPFSSGDTIPVKEGIVNDSGNLKPGSTGYYDYVVWAGTSPKPGDNPCKGTTDPGVYVK